MDGMGREVGGGFRMGNTCNPWLIHVSVWQKPLQYCKVISFQLIKINEKKSRLLGGLMFTISICTSGLKGGGEGACPDQ